MHSNKVLRNGVDSGKAAVAAIAQLRASAVRQAGTGGMTSAAIDTRKESWMKRLLSRVLRHLLTLIRPALYKYREYINRPILEQLTRIVSEPSFQSKCHGDILNIITQLQQRLDHIENYALAAARRVAVNCGNGRILVRSSVGYVFCSPTDGAMLACLLDTGELESGTRLLIERLVQPGMTFVDVGANIGLHTLAAARAMRGMGRVVAFEPYGPTRALLAESVFINGFAGVVEIHEAAVSSQPGMQALHLGKTSGYHSLYALEESSAAGEVTKVPVVTLADVIPRETRIDCIKIDVEGAELEVLKSAMPFIESNPDIALIVEFGPSHLTRVGISVGDWFDRFAAMDLDYQAIDPIKGTLSPFDPRTFSQLESANLLVARRGSSVWAKACEAK
ncbi:FkbM family methyltransferase [uncultured Pigmentiphaga sp.]|jgi:methyltransferase, FkbM family|uniref:FkbM family methyltransferase n=1 Tax=uncultured Pigmentiphaga sp. TaxID=340361 RepID=UPI0026387F3E|nr:FkbM family methyltransferase [uncultured Pigmentiphaga sp.]